MKRNKYLYLVFFAACVSVVSWYLETHIYSIQGNRISSVFVREKEVRVEVVADSIKLQQGLGGRKGLCENCGMLFVFSQEARHAFWMRDMKFPLDIAWIRKGEIVHLEKNISPDDLRTLVPEREADLVLEVAAGTADKFSWQVGDEVRFE